MPHRTTADWLVPLRERGLLPAATVAAYVVGSAARGWHNARSDFDIHVVTAAGQHSGTGTEVPVPLDPPFVRGRTFYARDRRWEVTYWVADQFDQMLAKVSWQAYEDGGTVPEEPLSWREELSLARLGNCLPLYGEEWIAHSQERLARSAFRSFMVTRSLSEAANAVEDALGQMESGDLESATISARTAFGRAIDALLEGEGEYGSHIPKWRPNRFRAAAPRALSFAEYWAVETMRGYDPADPRPWITSVLTVCQDLAMRVKTS
ncbi:hypothetical protein [Streptomyces sp. NPDC088196]|uniref:hypothetical protein n=1 Tax=Streptomyces sp. NPDC088196 TaxID=3154868 RepID=UPI00344FAF7C